MEQAVRLSGGNAELQVRLGDMYLARGDLAGAGRQAERAIERTRQLASAWALRGDVLRRQGNVEEALANYHRALSYQKCFPRVQLAIAEIYRDRRRPMRALATLRSLVDGYAVGERPQRVLFLEGLVLKDLGRYDEAVQSLGAATKRGEPTRELLYHFAEAQLLAGDPTNAQLTAERAMARASEQTSGDALQAQFQSLNRRLRATMMR
jgi:tetratricopeptide (TPR) repeat protein